MGERDTSPIHLLVIEIEFEAYTAALEDIDPGSWAAME
jgi:hypothetical protein